MKKYLWLLLLSLLPYLHYQATDGFRPDKILYRQPYLYTLNKKPASSADLTALLQQNFTYLGKGRQVYVFESQDHKYVIKFLRNYKYQLSLWERFCLHTNLISPNQKRAIVEKKNRLDRALQSYHIACDYFGEEEKILYAHLSPDETIVSSIHLIDKLGQTHVIDPAHTVFLVQKKAISLETALFEAKDNPEAFQKILLSFLHKVENRVKKNIANRDSKNYLRNAGCFHFEVMEMDVGSFYTLDTSPEKEFQNSIAPLHAFLSKHMKNQLSFFEKETKESLHRVQKVK